MQSYLEVYQSWKNDPESFWLDAAKGVDWISAPQIAFDKNSGVYGRWFPDGVCNTSYNF